MMSAHSEGRPTGCVDARASRLPPSSSTCVLQPCMSSETSQHARKVLPHVHFSASLVRPESGREKDVREDKGEKR